MKKILLMLALAACTACSNNEETECERYAARNDAIVDGRLTGAAMHFLGRSTVTDGKGAAYTDESARFEFADASADGNGRLIVYMHQTRFAAGMPAVEMRIPAIAYTGEGNTVSFSVESIVPEALIAAAGSYQPMERYRLTDVEGSINGIICRMRFVCAGEYKVEYEGALLNNEMIGAGGEE